MPGIIVNATICSFKSFIILTGHEVHMIENNCFGLYSFSIGQRDVANGLKFLMLAM